MSDPESVRFSRTEHFTSNHSERLCLHLNDFNDAEMSQIQWNSPLLGHPPLPIALVTASTLQESFMLERLLLVFDFFHPQGP